MSISATKGSIPVLLLKTKSTPHDGYEEHFSTVEGGRYQPVFVPVLEHRFKEDTLQAIRALVERAGFDTRRHTNHKRVEYGGIIFTSQRAVEAFTKVIEDIRRDGGSIDELLPVDTPFYVVGPATVRGLRALDVQCPIVGEESGNGEALAAFILDHYNGLEARRIADIGRRLPLLFLVGEQRRDIIPKTLRSPDLEDARRIPLDELVVYETGEMQSFRSDFASTYSGNSAMGHKQQWIVVFSPTGCKAMLESLGLLESSTGKVKLGNDSSRTTFIATIGPTTRDYLIKEFGFEPDVCAAKPSPEGIGAGIKAFMDRRALA